MENAVKYISLTASVIAVISVITIGLKVSDNDYDIISECRIAGICLMILFICAVCNTIQTEK